MVGKLIKYEFKAYWRYVLPMLIIVASAGVLTRFVQIFEPHVDSVLFPFYCAVEWSSALALLACIVIFFLMVMVLSVVRFYKNLFSVEGYLTFTLPVSTTAHIFVKLLVSVVIMLLAVAVSGFSLTVATFGEMLFEILKAGIYMLKEAWRELGFHVVLFAFEYLLLLFSGYVSNLLIYYSCISIGQMAKKNRILAAFGVYFLYYILSQILATLLYFVGMVLLIFFGNIIFAALDSFDILTYLLENYAEWLYHIFFLGSALFSAVMSVVLFFVNRKIIKSKLNLE
jgi:hypothetical protein